MAGTQHTQTHPKFIYTFLAVHRDCIADGKNTVHVAADTLVDACEMLNDMGYIRSRTQRGDKCTIPLLRDDMKKLGYEMKNFRRWLYKLEGDGVIAIDGDDVRPL
ncbi:hypothetical protein BvCmsH55A_00086 [Escherichia coli]|uniref:hypothetical protein n=1 Tax=Escherichia coli TaxID=562 RepID=UPI0010BAF001|nr:hypothetical protein [Escherichia coli]GCG92838.1 hypothetical protein BvCmsH55A_00086 [Escherichia coli]